MSYQKTGYQVGAPRLGEIRPITMRSLHRANYEKRKKERMGEEAYKLEKAIYRQLYNTLNRERVNELAKISRKRRAEFQQTKVIITVG